MTAATDPGAIEPGTPDADRMGPSAENTDLERRVLAHERILQSLIAHMAEAEPQFLDRLLASFGGPERMPRQEHDYTDTDAYAEQFIREVTRLLARRAGPDDDATQFPASTIPLFPGIGSGAALPGPGPTAIDVTPRAGLWQVTRDGSFYGDYLDRSRAQGAVEAAVLEVAGDGGSSRVSWPQSPAGDR